MDAQPKNRWNYLVYVDKHEDHKKDESRVHWCHFDEFDAALACCRLIVDRNLELTHRPEMSAQDLLAEYMRSGEHPWIRCLPGSRRVFFSARNYARARCKALCAQATPAPPEPQKKREPPEVSPELHAKYLAAMSRILERRRGGPRD